MLYPVRFSRQNGCKSKNDGALRRKYAFWIPAFAGMTGRELLLTPVVLSQGLPAMRDVNDLPILASAMMGDVDLLLTGDKDFEVLDIERPVILSPSRFMELYAQT